MVAPYSPPLPVSKSHRQQLRHHQLRKGTCTANIIQGLQHHCPTQAGRREDAHMQNVCMSICTSGTQKQEESLRRFRSK